MTGPTILNPLFIGLGSGRVGGFHGVVAQNAEALDDRFHAAFTRLWRRCVGEPRNFRLPEAFDDFLVAGLGDADFLAFVSCRRASPASMKAGPLLGRIHV